MGIKKLKGDEWDFNTYRNNIQSMSDKQWQQIVKCKELRSLALNQCENSGDYIDDLLVFPKLSSISISGSHLRSEKLSKFELPPSCAVVLIRNCSADENGFSVMPESPQVTDLCIEIDNNKGVLSPEEINALAGKFPNLSRINLTNIDSTYLDSLVTLIKTSSIKKCEVVGEGFKLDSFDQLIDVISKSKGKLEVEEFEPEQVYLDIKQKISAAGIGDD